MKKYTDKVQKHPKILAEFMGIIYFTESNEKLKELLLTKFYIDKYKKIISSKQKEWPENYLEIKDYIEEKRDIEVFNRLSIDINFFKPLGYVNINIIKKYMKKLTENNFSLIPLSVENALNKDEPHLIMFNDRNEIDENNPYVTFIINITGNNIEYLTFFKDELEDSISLKDEEVTFYNPSSLNKGPKYFNLQQFLILIKHLTYCIENGNFGYISLLEKLNSLKEAFKNQNKNILRYKRDYEILSKEDKLLCLRYFVSLFLLSQYLRWWKGPSFDWVYQWNENYTKGQAENTFREQMVVELINDLEHIISISSSICKTFLLSLKWIDYDFQSGGFRIGKDTLTYLYENLRNNNFCLADASDRFGKTSIAFIFLLVCNYELTIKPTLDMYETFSNYVNFIINIKISSSSLKTFKFFPVKFEKSGHIDPKLKKKYET